MATTTSKSQLDLEAISGTRFLGTEQNLVSIAGRTEFTYPVGEIVPSNGPTITLTATLQNFLASGTPQYQWQYINVSNNVWTDFTGATASAFNLAHDDAAWAGSNSLRIRCFSRGYSGETIILKTYDLEDSLIYSIDLSSPTLVKQAPTAVANGLYTSITIQGRKRSLRKLAPENFGYVTVTRNTDAEAAVAINTATVPYTLAPAIDSQADSYTVRLYDSSTKTTLLDIKKVPVTYQGTGAVTPVLSNDTHIFSTNYNGVITSYVGSGTELRVYEGISELVYDGVGTTNGTWRVSSRVGTGINATAEIQDSGIYATVLQASGMSDPTTTATIVYNIAGKMQNGDSFTTTVTQTFLKSKERSPISVAIQGTSWDDNLVNSYFTTNYGSIKVFGDRATVYDEATAFVATREWNGSAWVLGTAKIDGNLLVTGSVKAASIDARGLSIKDADGNIILAAGTTLSGGINLVGNSGFIKNNGTLPTNWNVYNNGGISVTTSVQAGGVFGQNYYRITANASTTQTLGIYISGSGNNDSVKSWEPGQTYCISFWAKGSGGILGKSMYGFYSNMGFTNTVVLENPAVTGTWQRYVFRGVPLNNASTAAGELYISWLTSGTLASGSVIDISCPKVELGFQPGSWTPSPQDTLNNNITISPTGQLQNAGGGQITTLTASDTRNANEPPSWYPVGITEEFKSRTAIGAPGVSTYGILRTEKGYSDASGGAVIQTFKTQEAEYKRASVSGNYSQWEAWTPKLDRKISLSNVDRFIEPDSIDSVRIGQSLQSTNYVDGVAGWKISKTTGSAEFQNVVARGTILATSGYFKGDLTGATGVFSGEIRAGSINLDDSGGSTNFYNAGTYNNLTIPSGVTNLKATLIGGGGGGGSYASNESGAGGGGGGGLTVITIPVVAGQVFNLTVGAGGGVGQAGGTTTLTYNGSNWSAGGGGAASNLSAGAGGSGTTYGSAGTNGAAQVVGVDAYSNTYTVSPSLFATGGNSGGNWGPGGAAASGGPGGAGGAYGGGGAGGNAGATGRAIIELVTAGVAFSTINNSTRTKSISVNTVIDGTPRAWINFNGVTGVINSSFNVSSITDYGTGNFSVNFTTSMSNTNYSVVGSACGRSAHATRAVSIAYDVAPSTTSVRIYTGMTGGEGTVGMFEDSEITCIAVLGAQ